MVGKSPVLRSSSPRLPRAFAPIVSSTKRECVVVHTGQLVGRRTGEGAVLHLVVQCTHLCSVSLCVCVWFSS